MSICKDPEYGLASRFRFLRELIFGTLPIACANGGSPVLEFYCLSISCNHLKV
jgi:hypothetical protein